VAELAHADANVSARQLDRREEPGESRRRRDGHRHGGQPDVKPAGAKRLSRLRPRHQQALAAEGTQTALAQVGGEDVQLRLLG
jgi:hypothetical protein